MPVKVELLRLGGTSAPANWKEKKSFRTAVYISPSRCDQTVEDSSQLLSRQSELCRAFLRDLCRPQQQSGNQSGMEPAAG